MKVRAHVRVWQEAPGGFVPKKDRGGVDVFEHSIQLEPWEGGHVVVEAEPASIEASLDTPSLAVPEAGVVTRLREIGVRFYQLSFSEKSEIAGRLKLLEEEDMNQPDFERFRRVFLRAHSRGQLEELAQAISDAGKG
jgi:GTPase-associated adaptor domain